MQYTEERKKEEKRSSFYSQWNWAGETIELLKMVNIFQYWVFPSKVAFTAYMQTKSNVSVISEFLGFKTTKQVLALWHKKYPCHSAIEDCIHSCIIIRLFTVIWECKIIFSCLGAEKLCLFYGAVNKYWLEFKCLTLIKCMIILF